MSSCVQPAYVSEVAELRALGVKPYRINFCFAALEHDGSTDAALRLLLHGVSLNNRQMVRVISLICDVSRARRRNRAADRPTVQRKVAIFAE